LQHLGLAFSAWGAIFLALLFSLESSLCSRSGVILFCGLLLPVECSGPDAAGYF